MFYAREAVNPLPPPTDSSDEPGVYIIVAVVCIATPVILVIILIIRNRKEVEPEPLGWLQPRICSVINYVRDVAIVTRLQLGWNGLLNNLFTTT